MHHVQDTHQEQGLQATHIASCIMIHVRIIMHNQTDPFHVNYQIEEIRTMVSPLYDSTTTITSSSIWL